MDSGSFAEYLASLDKAALTDLLRVRADVRALPAPLGFAQLAERLCGPDSLVSALRNLNRDCVVVGEAVAVLGPTATVPAVARLLGAPEPTVRELVDELCRRGLAWIAEGSTVFLPERLAAHWSADVGAGRPAATIARTVLVDDLRTAAAAHGIEVDGLRKQDLIARLTEALADTSAVAGIVAGLTASARTQLDELRHGHAMGYAGYRISRAGNDANHPLAAAGLALRAQNRWELPREVAVAAWLSEREVSLTGPPDIPRVAVEPTRVLGTAQQAAQDTLRATTALLDEAGSTPMSALKKGGVGSRERSRLAARLALPADVVLLAIDLAHAAGLLGRVDGGYAPTSAYPDWREQEPNHQWAALVTVWFGAEHAPTSRELEDGKELPPPLPLASGAGMIRRALLRAIRGGRSSSAATEHIDWFCPLHEYDDTGAERKLAAATREGELLGVLAADVLTEYGEHLLSVTDDDPTDPVRDLGERVAPHFPDASCTVVLQSDLTAMTSGQPTVAVARLLGTAAVCETRGTASVWRFSAESVRQAMDSGWTAQSLLAELATMSDKPLPQPLEYLINDVARRHGQVRVRGVSSCVLADEATALEILHTRKLAKLQLAQLSPTVLSSPYEPAELLVRLRAAGFAPVAEDAQGVVLVEERSDHQADASSRPVRSGSRARLAAAELAEQIVADPLGEVTEVNDSDTLRQLSALGGGLTEAELALLADALDHQRDVRIGYRDRNGNRTVRTIQPFELHGRWLESWCHLRSGDREFTVGNIESVAPA